MIKLRFFLVVSVMVAVFFAGCAKPPIEEMNNAVAAVSRAENDPDVVAYAAQALSRAREALAQMQTEADAKRYESAKRLAAEAQSLAERAISDGQAAAARAKEDAENAIRAMQNAISETEQVLNNASRSPPAGVNIQALEKEFSDARGIANQATVAQNEGNYSEAFEKSQAVRSALSSINSRLSQAVISASRKK
ncbi:MAG: DUF4398 domain-containing protein [Spirochaetaceae bacterium]|jgi:hypothetical protein|nr:DUF4398 domain-containing protein [Spirochaetaceae bacterium]